IEAPVPALQPVGKATPAPPVHLDDLAAPFPERLLDPVGHRGDHLVVRVGRQDEHDLVLPHSTSSGLYGPLGEQEWTFMVPVSLLPPGPPRTCPRRLRGSRRGRSY